MKKRFAYFSMLNSETFHFFFDGQLRSTPLEHDFAYSLESKTDYFSYFSYNEQNWPFPFITPSPFLKSSE